MTEYIYLYHFFELLQFLEYTLTVPLVLVNVLHFQTQHLWVDYGTYT